MPETLGRQNRKLLVNPTRPVPVQRIGHTPRGRQTTTARVTVITQAVVGRFGARDGGTDGVDQPKRPEM